MISSEAPALFSKACEIFILEVATRSSGSSPPAAPYPGGSHRLLDSPLSPSSPCAPDSPRSSLLQLTLRAWAHSEENKRRTLQRSDVAGAIAKTDIFDFLVDIVPREEFKEEAQGRPPTAAAAVGLPVRSGPQWPARRFRGASATLRTGAQLLRF